MAQASTDPNTTERPGVIWRRQLIEEGHKAGMKRGERAAVLRLARALAPDLTTELEAMTDPTEMHERLLAYLQHR